MMFPKETNAVLLLSSVVQWAKSHPGFQGLTFRDQVILGLSVKHDKNL